MRKLRKLRYGQLGTINLKRKVKSRWYLMFSKDMDDEIYRKLFG